MRCASSGGAGEGFGINGFSFLLMTKAGPGWNIQLYDQDGVPFRSCTFAGGRVDCPAGHRRRKTASCFSNSKRYNPAEVARLTALSREVKFVEGRISNPANTTKDNLQADLADPEIHESTQIVAAAFSRSRAFLDFAMPKRIAPPLLCRYEPGMKYGAHADAAVIALAGGTLRSDISCTVFISGTIFVRDRRWHHPACP